MRIGIDIDGVLYPWTDVANEALVEKFGIADPGPHLHWDWIKEQLTREQWAWLWSAEGQAASFGKATRTYPGVVDAVNAILRDDHDVHFVTHRDPRRTAVQTALFLSYHFGGHPWAGMHVLQSGTKKHSLATWDVFVDDKPQTVRDMLIYTRAQVFVPARPWNDEFNPEPRLVRYTDPSQVAEWVLSQ